MTALVTGASSGIGKDIASQLAAQGLNLIITARRKARLEELAELLTGQFGVEVLVVASDLSAPGASAALFEQTEGAGKAVDVLINNAGFGTQNNFVETPWDTLSGQLQLNIVALTHLSHLFGNAMKERGRGWIMNVASIGAYLPTPKYATYAAGKSYVRNFTEAFAYEMAPSGVRVCSVCPGATKTEFMDVAGHSLPIWQKPALMSSERCARIAIKALFGWRRNKVTGFWNGVGMFLLRLVPRRVMVWVSAKIMG